jgi:hypothetical protein
MGVQFSIENDYDSAKYLGASFYMVYEKLSYNFGIACFHDEDSALEAWDKCGWAVCLFQLENNKVNLIKKWGQPFAVKSILYYGSSRIPLNYVFISYKPDVATDSLRANELFDILTASNAQTFLDKVTLEHGLPTEGEIMEDVLRSQIYVPLISEDAFNEILTRTQSGRIDYFMFEIIVILAYWNLKEECEGNHFIVCQRINPLFVNGYFPYCAWNYSNPGLKKTILAVKDAWNKIMQRFFGSSYPQFPFDRFKTFDFFFEKLWGFNGHHNTDEICNWILMQLG